MYYAYNKSFITVLLPTLSSVIGRIGAPGTVITGSNGIIDQLECYKLTMCAPSTNF